MQLEVWSKVLKIVIVWKFYRNIATTLVHYLYSIPLSKTYVELLLYGKQNKMLREKTLSNHICTEASKY